MTTASIKLSRLPILHLNGSEGRLVKIFSSGKVWTGRRTFCTSTHQKRSETEKRFTKMLVVKIFSLDKARRRRQYRVYGKLPQRRIAEKDYHEALRTPGISPL